MSQGLNVHGSGFVGGKEIYYASLDDWKADLKQQAAAFNAQQQTPAPTVSSTATATAPASQNVPPATASKAATASLPTDGAPVTDASVALQLILSAQERAHATPASGTRTETFGASNHAASQTAAAPQTNTSQVTSAPSDTRLDHVT